MNIEEFRDYCLSMPMATEDTPFGEDYIVFRIMGKIFGCISLANPDYAVLKCDPDRAIELRDKYADIEPAWHWNKRHWNQHRLSGSIPDALMHTLIRHSYSLVVAKLPRRLRDTLPPNVEE